MKNLFISYILISLGLSYTLFADEATEHKAFTYQLQEVAKVERKKLEDIVAYLESKGINPSVKSFYLNLGEYITMGTSHGEGPGKIKKLPNTSDEPIVYVGINSNLELELKSTDVIYVFGMIAGDMTSNSSSCIDECPAFSIEGHVYKFQIEAINAFTGIVHAQTSIGLIGPNAMRHLRPHLAFPTTIYSYLVTTQQFKKNPKAFEGFIKKYQALKRN